VHLFDTEVDRVASKDVVETLLKIRADGGTDISRVMEEALRKPGNSLHIIISDGITDAPEALIKKFIQKCGRRTRLILIPPANERYRWVQELKRLNNVFYVKDVAQLEKAALQAVSS
jgi:predicted metal-dependent peptidase